MCKFRFVLADTQDYIDEKESNVDGFIKMLLYVKLQSPHVGSSVLDEPGRRSLSWSEKWRCFWRVSCVVSLATLIEG